jgi:membrane protein
MARATHPDVKWWQGDRGRQAERPQQIPARGWVDILKRVKQRIARSRLSIIAAGVAFYALMAIPPALIALVSIYGLIFDPQQVVDQIRALSGFLPEEAANVMATQLGEVANSDRTALGVGSAAAILLALWSASAGMRTLMEALNVAYEEEETRGTIRFYATALLLTLLAIVGALLAIALVVAVPAAMQILGLGAFAKVAATVATLLVLAGGMLIGLAVVFRYGPSRTKAQWRWTTPGAVFATLAWIIGSALFSLYVANFADYNKTYGSMGAIVILLTWFLLTAYVMLIGGELNAEMERQTEKDTTEARKPMGQRGASAADTIGPSR